MTQHKYLVTTDADTGEIVRIEQLGSTGELVELALDSLEGVTIDAKPLAPAPRSHADDNDASAAPGVFFNASLPETEPGVFISTELPETEPGVFVSSELPQAPAPAEARPPTA